VFSILYVGLFHRVAWLACGLWNVLVKWSWIHGYRVIFRMRSCATELCYGLDVFGPVSHHTELDALEVTGLCYQFSREMGEIVSGKSLVIVMF